MESTLDAQTDAARQNAKPSARPGLLALFALLSFVTLALGGWLTSIGFGTWYDELQKPPFQPPGWLFSPVWTFLFTLLAIATWRVARGGAVARTALQVYGLQLVCNILWSLFFFTLHRPAWALVDIVLLDALVVAMVLLYRRVDWVAGWLLVPYAVWLGLATAINSWIVLNN